MRQKIVRGKMEETVTTHTKSLLCVDEFVLGKRFACVNPRSDIMILCLANKKQQSKERRNC